MVSAAVADLELHVVHVVPDVRTPEERYRLYRWRKPEGLKVLSTSPTLEGIGTALGVHHQEGDITANDRIGVMDTLGRDYVAGTWIVNPYAKGIER